jgi:hypothetical protein
MVIDVKKALAIGRRLRRRGDVKKKSQQENL